MTNPVNATLLAQLRESQEFHAVMQDMLHLRPITPKYRPCQTAAEEQMLIEKIKFQTGATEGFDLLWNHLVGKKAGKD